MFRAILAVVGALGIVAFGAGVALAQSPHFLNSKTSVTINGDGDLTATWKEAGLGTSAIDYSFSANASVTCVCVTKSGNCPSAANKATFSSAVADSGTIIPKNGNVNGSLTIEAPGCPASASPTCGGGQRFELGQVNYTNISLSDETNDIQASGLPTSLSTGVLFSCQ